MKDKLRKNVLSRKIQKKDDYRKDYNHINSAVIEHDVAHIPDNNFYKIKYVNDIIKIQEDGDIYKGIMVASGETKIVARITGKAFSFPVAICSSDAEKKIREAYTILNQTQKA